MLGEKVDGALDDDFAGGVDGGIDWAPVVAGVFDDHDFDRGTEGLGFFLHVVGVVDGDGGVFVALDHEEGRGVFFEVLDGAHFAIAGELFPGRGGGGEEARSEAVFEVGAVVVVVKVGFFEIARAIPGDAGDDFVRGFYEFGIAGEGFG